MWARASSLMLALEGHTGVFMYVCIYLFERLCVEANIMGDFWT